MQFLRTFFASSLGLGAAIAVAASAFGGGCSSSANGSVDNGTFDVPATVTQGVTFQATYKANTPGVYPNVQVLPVSTYYIGVADGGAGFVAKEPCTSTSGCYVYAVSNGVVLGYQQVKIEAAK